MSTHAQQFATRCAAAIAHHLPDTGHAPELLTVIAGSYDAFQLMLYQQTERKNRMPPSRDDVAEYLKEIGYEIDPDEFMDFYTERGWCMSNGKKLQDWCCTLRRWKRNGWGQTKGRTGQHMQASLGALQIQLEKISEEIRDIVRPGGSAHARLASSMAQSEIDRYNKLIAERDRLRIRIAEGL